MKRWRSFLFDILNIISTVLLFLMRFVLLTLTLQCTCKTGLNIAWVVSIFYIPNIILLVLSVLDIKCYFGNTFSLVMFASRDETNIIFGDFLNGIFCKPHLLLSLTVCMGLSTMPSCSLAHTILTWTGINYLCTS